MSRNRAPAYRLGDSQTSVEKDICMNVARIDVTHYRSKQGQLKALLQ